MGLIFNKKLSSGGMAFKKRIADKDISKKDIIKISEEMGFTRHGAEHHFKKFLMKAQSGGLDRKEFHEGMQDMIAEGYVTKKQAMRMTKEAGIERKDLRYYKDISEYEATQKNKNPADAKKSVIAEQRAGSNRGKEGNGKIQATFEQQNNHIKSSEEGEETKPTSIYNILHKH